LREKQEYFWGTYDNYVFIPKDRAVQHGDDPPEPLYERTGGQNLYQNFENRLTRTRHLVTRRQAQMEWAHTRRLHSIFYGVFPQMKTFEDLDKERSKTLRARYDGALSANAALQNLLKREAGRDDAMKLMGSDAFLTITTGERDFTRADALWVYMNGQGENYSLNDVSLSTDMFVREEVSAEETFKIEGIPLRPYFFDGPKLRTTKTKVGLYQISSTMEEWAEDLLSRLRERKAQVGRPLKPYEIAPIFMANPEWVNDDTGLIGQCHTDTAGTRSNITVMLVSNDRKLANKMADTCNVTVIRLDPQEFVRIATCHELTVTAGIDTRFLKEYGHNADHVYVDTGSVAASASKLVEEDGVFFHRTVRSSGWEDGTRTSHVTLTQVRRKTLRVQTHRPQSRPRLWRQTSRPHESVYSSHDSWRSARSKRSDDSSWWRAEQPPPMPTRDVNIPGSYPISPKGS